MADTWYIWIEKNNKILYDSYLSISFAEDGLISCSLHKYESFGLEEDL